MQLTFQRRPADLATALILAALAVPGTMVEGPGRWAIALPSFLLVPGYLVTAILFPRARDIRWHERLLLALALSLTVVPSLGLLLALLPTGLRLAPLLAALLGFDASAGAVAFHRRLRLPVLERPSLTLLLTWPRLPRGTLDRVTVVGIAGSLLLVAAVGARLATQPRGVETFTEFYLLNEGGTVGEYPTNLTPGQAGRVLVGIVNHEGRPMIYVVRAELKEVERSSSPDGNPANRIIASQSLATWEVQLEEGGRREILLEFPASRTGLFRLDLGLWLPASATSYRSLHLWVTVSGP